MPIYNPVINLAIGLTYCVAHALLCMRFESGYFIICSSRTVKTSSSRIFGTVARTTSNTSAVHTLQGALQLDTTNLQDIARAHSADPGKLNAQLVIWDRESVSL